MYRHRLRQTATNHVRDSTLLSVPSKSSVKYRGRRPRCPNRSAGKERASKPRGDDASTPICYRSVAVICTECAAFPAVEK